MSIILPLIIAFKSLMTSASSEYGVLEFSNLGYDGTYYQVSELNDPTSDSCSCAIDTDNPVSFSGSNAPLNEELSVHFRGPLILNQFAYYVSENFDFYSSSSSSNKNWSRQAYFSGSDQIAENVTFLTNAGEDSTCLGKALAYADTDGISLSSSSRILNNNTLINSDEEFAIFSNISCEDSGINNDCGVYRDNIPAFHGYYGKIKLFLFEFKMPNESSVSETNASSYNMPAIWLLNSRIPRTSQYPTNSSCSCWRSGCGEFDIFEILNTTDVEDLYTTIHNYQGTDDIESGLPIYGYIKRDTSSVMKGGVLFDANGTAITFLSENVNFSSSIDATDLISWIETEIDSDGLKTRELSSVDSTTDSDSSESSSNQIHIQKSLMILNLLLLFFLIFK
ncbi:Toh1p ASCRUDRAFT_10359 [Ascoidea rubescens DSM 1968]|uniref:glucan endo-1,3-beta-D-glucosidase n=1 Tax=Ascoidea rubescens DSM 1968 TaxID=1344418 RepID=A0A1D2V9H6_9ASCO|nr:hypothetical protein ASCRUDRAFT_10359 [Ascoidea rubescens DSM 1968]ODV58322.1 hypothetical protein ASCRUDRAFT_10359 [Ascoidea rubescens DSM 1968]